MKNIIICILIFSTALMSCNRKGGNNGNTPPSENDFSTPAEAFEQAKKSLPDLLNDAQKKAFGLESAEVIRQLSKTNEIPVSYLDLNKLKDSSSAFFDEAVLFGLGDSNGTKICISVRKQNNRWIQSVIGMKKYVTVLQQRTGVSRIIDVPGLEMSFVEVKTGDSTAASLGYYPVADYPDANIYQQETYSKAQLLNRLEAYRITMERKFGKDFTSGNLDR